jgi:hypothetical protein
MNESSAVWPYSERSGVSAGDLARALGEKPEIHLSKEQLADTHAFAEGLFRGEVEGVKCESGLDLEKVNRLSPAAHSQDFYLGYFLSDAGKQDLEQMGLSPESQLSQIAAHLKDIQAITTEVDPKARKKIAANSHNWYKAELARQLEENPQMDKDFEDDEPLTVNYKPEDLLNKIEHLQAYRRFNREIKRKLKEQPSENSEHKDMVLSLYRARVNDLMAHIYPSAVSLAEQLEKGNQQKELVKRLAKAMPALKATFLQEREDRIYGLDELGARFTRRLDFLRNGAAWNGGDHFTPVSSELAELARELAQADRPESLSVSLPQEVIEKLENSKLDAAKMKKLAGEIIQRRGLLSQQESDWTEAAERDGPAPDDQWQVIISPKISSMSVSGKKKVFWLPEDFDRTLIQESPAGVLPGMAHELTHLLQAEADYETACGIPLAKIKGRRATTMKELGAIYEESKMQRRFGRGRPVNLHYLKALEAKVGGANKLQAARAFYESYTAGRQITDDEAAAARKVAADRTLRLYRYGGSDSQPLNYIEQELIGRALSAELPEEKVEAILINATSFDLPDLVRLYREGLVELADGTRSPADEVWQIFSENYLPAITA